MRLRTFERLWHKFNAEVFGNAMYCPRFARTRSNDYWACYMDTEPQSTIVVNYRNHRHMLAIFFHEMVHQYVDEVLGGEEHHHGELFWRTYYEFAPIGMPIAESF